MAKKSEAEYEAELIAAMKARRLQRATDLARQQADLTSQDFPLLPTSDVDALPSLPEEAGDALSPAQRLAVAAFVAGQTCAAAARAAGVSRRTIYNWRKEAAFTRAIDELSSEALEATAIRVRNLMLRSTRVLAESMLGQDAFNGAIRVANSARLWAAWNAGAEKLQQKLADTVETPNDGPVEGAADATVCVSRG